MDLTVADRYAIFPKKFLNFLETQKRVTHQKREQRRYKENGEYKYSATEWEDVVEYTYKEEILPQTLTQEDLINNRWPATAYRFQMEDGRVLTSEVEDTRDYGAENEVLDFMNIRDMATNEIVYGWTKEEINSYKDEGIEVLEPGAV